MVRRHWGPSRDRDHPQGPTLPSRSLLHLLDGISICVVILVVITDPDVPVTPRELTLISCWSLGTVLVVCALVDHLGV